MNGVGFYLICGGSMAIEILLAAFFLLAVYNERHFVELERRVFPKIRRRIRRAKRKLTEPASKIREFYSVHYDELFDSLLAKNCRG